MRLSDLMNGDTNPGQGVNISGLTADSREVQPGYLFAAIPGTSLDGRRFISDAIQRGAVAVLAPPSPTIALDRDDICLISDTNPRGRLARMAARFFETQPRSIAAITGTNGKTSVADFLRQIWTFAGHRAASLGTIGLVADGHPHGPGLTTPDPVEMHRLLHELADDGFDHLAIEASSHGLDQYRLDGLRVGLAAFTNLSRDHLDYHADMDAYLDAKLRLFEEIMAPGGTAVVNIDAPEARRVTDACRRRGHRLITFGTTPGADIRLANRQTLQTGQFLDLIVFQRSRLVKLPLMGDFQAMNALAALSLALGDGMPLDTAIDALGQLQGVPGRMQRVAESADGAPILVDYAHTPDALKTVLAAIRPHVTGRLRVVFGCGGDRDPGKRPLMGRAVAEGADVAILTDDNPRTEDASEIRRQTLEGCPDATEIGERADAIRVGIETLGPDDALVIAGKGHEPGQIVGSETLPFDDTDVARNIAIKLGGRSI